MHTKLENPPTIDMNDAPEISINPNCLSQPSF